MNLATLSGIYYSVGSLDLPISHNPNNRYGFKADDLVNPIFNYSPTNVDNFFYKPLKCIRRREQEFQTMIVESTSVSGSGLEGMSNADFISNGFQALFDAINILYDRSDVTNSDNIYTSKGDRLLSEASLSNRYKANSLYMDLVTLNGELRISYVKFKFRFYNNVDHTTVMLYFIPDAMFDALGFDDGRYNITYTTKNTTNDQTGLESILTNGNSSLITLEDSRNYTNVCMFSTTFNVLSNDVSGTILDTYSRTFFIHNVMYEGFALTDFKKILIVKKYLNNKYLSYGDERNSILNRLYPELFSESTSDIYPIVTKSVDGRFDSIATNAIIRNEIERRGLTIDLSDLDSCKRIEIIMMEGVGEFDSNDYSNLSKANRNFITPLMVVSNDPTIFVGVIFNNFKEFAPTFTGYQIVGETWEQFQFYVKLFLKLTTGVLPWVYVGLTDEQLSDRLQLPPSLQISTERVSIYNSEFINSIAFEFLDVKYTVHGFYKYEAIQ